MYLLGAEVKLEWVLGVTESNILYTDLDLLLIAPNGITTYLDSPIAEADFIAPTNTVEGYASYLFTPSLEGLYKVRLVMGTSALYTILSKIEMFVFDSTLVVNPLLALQHLNVVEIEDEGVSLTEEVSKMDFVGNGVLVTETAPNQVQVTIPGSIAVEDEGVELTPTAVKLNFVGDAVIVTETAPNELLITNIIPLTIEDEGNEVSTGVVKINVIGSGIAATESAPGEVIITTAPALSIEDEGIEISPVTAKINFEGNNIAVTEVVPGELLVTVGPSLEVEDNGIQISPAASKINFIGFNLTEPVANEIDISFGVPGAAESYATGYPFVFVDVDTFRIDGLDVTNLFNVGRRLSFSVGGVDIFGVVSSRDYDSTSAGNTTINVTMESAEVLANVAYEISITSGIAAWSPIASDPFLGGAINDIVTGVINSIQWWFAVGDNGKIATSSDAGISWALLTTITTEDFLCCTYDSLNETFWAGARAGILVKSLDGTTIIEDTTSIPALANNGGTEDITGIAYSAVATEGLILIYNGTTTKGYSVSSQDQGTTWVLRATDLAPASTLVSNSAKAAEQSGGKGAGTYVTASNNTGLLLLTPITDTTYFPTTSIAPDIPTIVLTAYYSSPILIVGTQNGNIYGASGWLGDDAVSFGGHINGLAFSSIHERVIAVADNGELGYWDIIDKDTSNSFTLISNGFNPLTRIMAVTWNAVNGIFIAVAKNGQICRSSNGTN